jgi:hypothetical protein
MDGIRAFVRDLALKGLMPQVRHEADDLLEPTASTGLRCHSYIVTPRVIYPIGVTQLPGAVTGMTGMTGRLVGGEVHYPAKQARDELGNPCFSEGQPVTAKYVTVDCGALTLGLEDCVQSFTKEPREPRAIEQMVRDEHVLLCLLSLYQLAAYLTIRCGSLEGIPDSAIMLLAQYQVKRGGVLPAAYQDPNTARCYQSPAKVVEGLRLALMRAQATPEYSVTSVVLDGASLTDSAGTVSAELTTGRVVSAMESQGLELLELQEVPRVDVKQLLRDYQHRLKMAPMPFAVMACNVARNNPEYKAWAHEAVFAALPTLKIGNPELFARSFEGDQMQHMLPIWCLLHRGGQDLVASLEAFVAETDTHLDAKDVVIRATQQELRGLQDTQRAALAAAQLGGGVPIGGHRRTAGLPPLCKGQPERAELVTRLCQRQRPVQRRRQVRVSAMHIGE